MSLFSSAVHWIWLPAPQREKNSYACFRRTIELAGRPERASVRVTADSRYELWVNGAFVGHGPVRSWPAPWPVDSYDVRHLLTAGRNIVAVLVTHFGISTFQYLHDEPGLIAEIEFDGRTVATDADWKCTPHDGYLWPVPRITCQQAWEEQFDARVAPGLPQEWSSATFDDAGWQPAKVLRNAGEPPHETFEPRDIPHLTLEVTDPVALRGAEVVRPADYTFALNPREFITARDKSMNHIGARMLLATFIHSDREQPIDLHLPHTRPLLPWKLNGTELRFDDHSLHHTDTGVAHATLNRGANCLMVRLPLSEHHYWANLNVRTQHPVVFSVNAEKAHVKGSTGWLAFGPFPGPDTHAFDEFLIKPEELHPDATVPRFEAVWERGELTEDDGAEPFCRAMTRDMVATEDAYARSVSDRVDASVAAAVDQPAALLDGNADWTTVSPPGDGADVRLLLEFPRETIGFHEFEVDAPPAAILDFHNFEFIQRDGRFNLNESMNNSFRYVCRAGVQRYKTFLRRGLKYTWVTLRNFRQPVSIRYVRVLTSTYPQAGGGAFACSDEKLTKIWNVGVQSVRCCSEDTYTDCPTYEQTFWVGDARNEALVDLIANGDPRLSARCLRLAGRSLQRSKIVESQVPSGWQNLLPTWTFLWMRWAQEHFHLTGDRAFGREMLAFLDRNIDGMRAEINDRGLFAMRAWNLFDWAPMDTPASGIVTHINCLASLGLRQAAQLAGDSGDDEKARHWSGLAARIGHAVNRHLWSDEKQAYLDCIRADGTNSPVFSQQTQTAAYISGVAAGDPAREARVRELVHHPPADFVKAGSPFFMFFLLEALAREGNFDALVETIRSYWGKQTDAGATTFWEMYQEEPVAAGGKGFGNPTHRLTRSHCHGWSAAPTLFLTQHVLGVQPARPGYETVRIAPKPAGLAWAQGRVPTPQGEVAVYWTRDARRFTLMIAAPPAVPLRVQLPVTGKVQLQEGTGDVDGATVTAPGPRLKLVVLA